MQQDKSLKRRGIHRREDAHSNKLDVDTERLGVSLTYASYQIAILLSYMGIVFTTVSGLVWGVNQINTTDLSSDTKTYITIGFLIIAYTVAYYGENFKKKMIQGFIGGIKKYQTAFYSLIITACLIAINYNGVFQMQIFVSNWYDAHALESHDIALKLDDKSAINELKQGYQEDINNLKAQIDTIDLNLVATIKDLSNRKGNYPTAKRNARINSQNKKSKLNEKISHLRELQAKEVANLSNKNSEIYNNLKQNKAITNDFVYNKSYEFIALFMAVFLEVVLYLFHIGHYLFHKKDVSSKGDVKPTIVRNRKKHGNLDDIHNRPAKNPHGIKSMVGENRPKPMSSDRPKTPPRPNPMANKLDDILKDMGGK